MSGQRAKTPGKKLTEAERRLWSRLRTNRILGPKFRRDVAIGHYVLGLASPRARLVVEVDDGRNNDRRAGEIRTIYLNALGFRVLRFWHSEVMRFPDAVLHAISEAVNAARPAKVHKTNSPSLPPAPAKAKKSRLPSKSKKG